MSGTNIAIVFLLGVDARAREALALQTNGRSQPLMPTNGANTR